MKIENKTELVAVFLVFVCMVVSLIVGIYNAETNSHCYPLLSSTGIISVLLLTCCLVVLARELIRFRLKRNNRVLLFRTLLVISIGFLTFCLVNLTNILFDVSPAKDHELRVNEVFSVRIQRDSHDFIVNYIGFKVPAELTHFALWQVYRDENIHDFALGSVHRVIWHSGLFGTPWCEYNTRSMITGARPSSLNAYRRAPFTMLSAKGIFTNDSIYRRQLISWNVPIEDQKNHPGAQH
jgi:amino acid transporter